MNVIVKNDDAYDAYICDNVLMAACVVHCRRKYKNSK